MYYIEKLKGEIGTPNLVICLDRFLQIEFAHVIVALAIILACGSRLPCVGSVSSECTGSLMIQPWARSLWPLDARVSTRVMPVALCPTRSALPALCCLASRMKLRAREFPNCLAALKHFVHDDRVTLEQLKVAIPPERIEQVKSTVAFMNDEVCIFTLAHTQVWNKFPFVEGARAAHSDNVELALNRAWRPQLAVIGAAGLPDLAVCSSMISNQFTCI